MFLKYWTKKVQQNEKLIFFMIFWVFRSSSTVWFRIFTFCEKRIYASYMYVPSDNYRGKHDFSDHCHPCFHFFKNLWFFYNSISSPQNAHKNLDFLQFFSLFSIFFCCQCENGFHDSKKNKTPVKATHLEHNFLSQKVQRLIWCLSSSSLQPNYYRTHFWVKNPSG